MDFASRATNLLRIAAEGLTEYDHRQIALDALADLIWELLNERKMENAQADTRPVGPVRPHNDLRSLRDQLSTIAASNAVSQRPRALVSQSE